MKTCRRPTLNMTKLIADLKSERSLRYQKTRTRNILNLNLQTCVRSCWCYSFHRQRRGCACPPGAWTQSTPGLWGRHAWWEKVATYQRAWWEGRICCTWPPWRVSTASLHTAHRTWKEDKALPKTDKKRPELDSDSPRDGATLRLCAWQQKAAAIPSIHHCFTISVLKWLSSKHNYDKPK